MFKSHKIIKYFNLTRNNSHVNLFCMNDLSEFDLAINDLKLSIRSFILSNRLKQFKNSPKYMHDKYLGEKKLLKNVLSKLKNKEFDKTYVAIHGLNNTLRKLIPEKVWYITLKNLTKT